MSDSIIPNTQKTIMVADDNEGILDVMRLILEENGYKATTTNNGRDLFDLKEPLPDLLFLDIMLSGTNGSELCTILKSNKKTQHMPILLLSANHTIAEIAENCGANGYLGKPFNIKQMLDLVELHTATTDT
jgi:CheY-like chemotaxis protein